MASQEEFQSLSGFFRPCNEAEGLETDAFKAVSIPVGFFQALQPDRLTGLVAIF